MRRTPTPPRRPYLSDFVPAHTSHPNFPRPGQLCLNAARCEQDLLTPPRVGPFLAQRPARALDPVDGHPGEAGLLDLLGQAIGGVQVGGGEELRSADRIGVAMLPVS